ncbi:MAG: hypothetical protein AAF738_05590 [Bacteroidota bacterium]
MLAQLKANLHRLKHSKEARKYLLFTFFKYLEYAITAFSFFYFADVVGPEQYGHATAGLLVVTYSGLAVLGVNQVLVKWYALNDNAPTQYQIIRYNILYNLLIGALLFGGINLLFSAKSYAFYVALIVALKLFQECCVNINRVKRQIFNINLIYLSFGLSLLAGALLYVDEVDMFFKVWSGSLLLSASVGGITVLPYLNILAHFSSFQDWVLQHFKSLISDGVKFALIGAILPLYLSMDRIMLINYSDISETALGNYQLADNISAVISLGFNSVLFIITPPLLAQLNTGALSAARFFKLGYKLFAGILTVSLIAGAAAAFIVPFVFPEYDTITYPLVMYIVNRSLFIGFFIYNNICIVHSKESLYVKLAYACFSLVAIGYGAAFFLIQSPQLLTYVLPVILLLAIVVLHFAYYWFIVKKHNFFTATT